MLPVSSGSVTSTLQISAAILADAGNYIATVRSSTEDNTVQFQVRKLTGALFNLRFLSWVGGELNGSIFLGGGGGGGIFIPW